MYYLSWIRRFELFLNRLPAPPVVEEGKLNLGEEALAAWFQFICGRYQRSSVLLATNVLNGFFEALVRKGVLVENALERLRREYPAGKRLGVAYALGRDGAAHRLRTHVAKAGVRMSTLGRKRIHPHSLRHTTAVHMRRAGDDPNAIAALLGHAQITTTERFYGHIDLEEKRKAIEANPPPIKPARGRWRRPEVLEFLQNL